MVFRQILQSVFLQSLHTARLGGSCSAFCLPPFFSFSSLLLWDSSRASSPCDPKAQLCSLSWASRVQFPIRNQKRAKNSWKTESLQDCSPAGTSITAEERGQGQAAPVPQTCSMVLSTCCSGPCSDWAGLALKKIRIPRSCGSLRTPTARFLRVLAPSKNPAGRGR